MEKTIFTKSDVGCWIGGAQRKGERTMDESTTKQCPECRGWLYAKGTRFSNRRAAEYLIDEVRGIIESTTEDSSKSDLQEALTTIEEFCVKTFRQMEGLEKPESRFLV